MTVFLSCCLLLSGCGQQDSSPETTVAAVPPIVETAPAVTQPTEKVYQPREDIETILVMGLDKYESSEKPAGYLNDQQSDFLMLFILDEKDGTCDVLHLNRDTMTEIRRLGIGGGDAGKFVAQITLAHTYGSGGSDSCLNTVRAVSDFLKGVKIDHYVAMTMDAVGMLNDMLGGITVEITEDMTAVDPELEKGKTVCLQGEQALKYVRARNHVGDDSNLSRMERQRKYLSALFEKLLAKANSDEDFLKSSLLKLSPYFQSDCSVNELSRIGDTMKELEMKPFTTIDGTAVKGEEFMEFYADEDSLNQVLIDLFCEPTN